MAKHYTRSLTTNASTQDVYLALTQDYASWWTTPDHPIVEIGDQAKFTFPPLKSYWTFEADELIDDQLIVLRCIDALHIQEGKPKEIEKEWLDTKLNFEILSTNSQTQINFTHIGLDESLHCFEICQQGWDFFFLKSLQSFLDTGVGMPHTG